MSLSANFAQFSEEAPAAWVRRVQTAAREAAEFPRSHRRVPEIVEDHIREALVGPYRIWFRIYDDEDRIDVLVVFHGARHVPSE